MRVPLSWLKELAPVRGGPSEIAESLSALGLAVESTTTVGSSLDGVVVARVLDVRPHPDADRILLVDVDPGDGGPLQICCGASNMAAGDLVALATVGTVMPDGLEIAARKMRGQMSNGMLCSARELELGDDHSGILVLPEGPEPGAPISEALELEPDVVFELDVLPNRPDALSILGVARDLAAHQGVPLTAPDPRPPEGGEDITGSVSVDLSDTELCGRFVARVISGVVVGPSPRWLARRLLAAGMRPINNVVDVSNYVMLELGQPNHAYDLALVAGRSLRVRRARPGEVLRTLDGVDRELDPSDGVIADGDDRVVGLAGVMGGADTEISETTTDVLVELAWWDPAAIHATAVRHTLHSEASLRFRRGTDPEIPPLAARRFAELLAATAPSRLHPGTVDERGHLPGPARIRVRTERVNSLLGTDLSRDEVAGVLGPIGFSSTVSGDDLDVDVPSWRPDTSIEVDVIEEVARCHGYSRIPRSVPRPSRPGSLTARQRARRSLRRALVGAGLSEAMPMPFLAPGDLERCGLPADGLVLANPLAAEESVLRTSLLPGLLGAVAHNERHRAEGVRLFELGRVFGTGAGGAITDVDTSERAGRVLEGEREHLAAVLAGDQAPAAVTLLETVLASIGAVPVVLRAEELPGLHPARSAVVEIAGAEVGEVGEVDPLVLERSGIEQRVAWMRLDLSTLLDLPVPPRLAKPVSRFPSTDIDLAFVVDESVPAAAVRATVRAAGGDLLRTVELFDVYRGPAVGEGLRSLAFRLRFQAPDRTMTDAEVADIRSVVVGEVESTHRARLRA